LQALTNHSVVVDEKDSDGRRIDHPGTLGTSYVNQ